MLNDCIERLRPRNENIKIIKFIFTLIIFRYKNLISFSTFLSKSKKKLFYTYKTLLTEVIYETLGPSRENDKL